MKYVIYFKLLDINIKELQRDINIYIYISDLV